MIMNDEVKARIEAAIGATWADIERWHPIQAESIRRTVGDPMVLIMNKLQEDAEFKTLLQKTDDEAGLAGFAKVLGPILSRVATLALGV